MKRKRQDESAATAANGPPYRIGWKEYVHFPDWKVGAVKAKIDTGARTSSLHVVGYEMYQNEGEALMVALQLSPSRRHPERMEVVHVPVVATVVVTDSGGHQELRPVVATTIRLGPVTKQVLVNVTNRASMLFRMLLGRKAIEGDFVVDPSQKYLMKEKK